MSSDLQEAVCAGRAFLATLAKLPPNDPHVKHAIQQTNRALISLECLAAESAYRNPSESDQFKQLTEVLLAEREALQPVQPIELERPKRKHGVAEALVRRVLSNGNKVLSNDLYSEAKREGVSKRSVERAKRKLRVKHERPGGVVYCYLPHDTDTAPDRPG
jgi:hypothetical protein